MAYLAPARARRNLTIIGDAQVTSLIVGGNKTQGVRYRIDGNEHTANADKVVLSAGVYHSPQILMLSGIGPRIELERHGISVMHQLDGIGENYQDHPVVTMTLKAKTTGHTPDARGRSTLKLYFKSDPAREYIDFHIILRDITTVSGIGDMIGFSCHLLEQTNRGRLTLQSSDPADLPIIDARMLEHPKDIQAMVSAMRFVRSSPLPNHWIVSAANSFRRARTKMDQVRPLRLYQLFSRRRHLQNGAIVRLHGRVDQHLRVHGMDNSGSATLRSCQRWRTPILILPDDDRRARRGFHHGSFLTKNAIAVCRTIVKREIIVSSFWLIFSFYVSFESYRLGLSTANRPGPGFFPFIAAVGIGLIAASRLINSLRVSAPDDNSIGRSRRSRACPRRHRWHGGLRVSARLLGFLLCTFLLVAFYLRLIAARRWSAALTFAAAVALLSHLFFDVLLKAELPRGLLDWLS